MSSHVLEFFQQQLFFLLQQIESDVDVIELGNDGRVVQFVFFQKKPIPSKEILAQAETPRARGVRG